MRSLLWPSFVSLAEIKHLDIFEFVQCSTEYRNWNEALYASAIRVDILGVTVRSKQAWILGLLSANDRGPLNHARNGHGGGARGLPCDRGHEHFDSPHGHARARVCDDARVCGCARVHGCAIRRHDDARGYVRGHARGNAGVHVRVCPSW